MQKPIALALGSLLYAALPAQDPGKYGEWDACTSIMVSRSATTDGSTMITYSADAPFLPRLLLVPGGEHEPGATVDVTGWEDARVRGRIAQARKTWGVVGLINERQVAIGETTTGGRRELQNPDGLLDYDALILLALQRAATAREAIDAIDALAAAHGYRSSGETFAIADPNEVWVMELLGRGPGQKGVLWVAARVPEGHLTVSANQSRILAFPRNDPENWRCSPDVVDFAAAKGWYDPARDGEFRWRDVYHPDLDVVGRRVCATRVWSIYRRAAPSQHFPDEWHRGAEGAEDYPLFVKPDRKLSVRDVMALMRDHYQGTPYDMTRGVAAGPFGSPYRFRGVTWKHGEHTYCWERPISSQQAGFVMLAQCRGWLPDAVGGIYWFTPDDAYTSVFLPLYCGTSTLPEPYRHGDYQRFAWDSAWWAFNLVSNLTYDRWSRIFPEVLEAQRAHEDHYLARQAAIDATAKGLADDPAALRRYLTDLTVATGERLVADWKDLAMRILTRHVDGYVKQPDGEAKAPGYPADWLARVVEESGDQLRVPPRRQ
ncbi:MAG: dipeptidase [Planctomycetes bacterium]|nr:dipeptidase [Planctomycetota bacterium]